MGIAYNNQGNTAKEIESYKKAIELDPDDAGAYNNLGNAYRKQGNLTKAIESYEKAIELKPDYAIAYNNRAVAYYYMKEYDKAWDDVYKTQSLGNQVHPGFLKALREASGR